MSSLSKNLPYVCSLFLYYFVEKYTNKRLENKKRARNISSLTHSTGSVLVNLLHIIGPNNFVYKLSKIWSTGYFLYDTSFILRNEKLNILRLAYLYHHLTTINFIHNDPELFNCDKFLFWGELSNIASNIVYDYMHSKPLNKQKIKYWKGLQKWSYISIRIPVLGYYILKTMKNTSLDKSILFISPVYIMGLIWSYKLLKK
tara:strand:+ start:257 stop:859 length:603 start_codon:yes stop_codon:yes gene_type:complete